MSVWWERASTYESETQSLTRTLLSPGYLSGCREEGLGVGLGQRREGRKSSGVFLRRERGFVEDGGQSYALWVRRPWLKSHCTAQELCDLGQAQKMVTALAWPFTFTIGPQRHVVY